MIYEPVTEFGKKITSLLKFDDGVRLDIHDYLEEIEPQIQEALEKAKKFDRYIEHLTSIEEFGVWGAINKLDNKLEAIKKMLPMMSGWVHTDGSPVEIVNYIRQEIEKILGGSEFTTERR